MEKSSWGVGEKGGKGREIERELVRRGRRKEVRHTGNY